MRRHSPFLGASIRILAIIAIALSWLLMSPLYAVFLTVFFVWLALGLDPRIVGGVALLFLVAIPPLLYLGQQAQAEQLANFAFILLSMTVLLQIFELMAVPQLRAYPQYRNRIGSDIRPRFIPYHVLWERARVDGVIPPRLLYEG
jgi:hypothetical protein